MIGPRVEYVGFKASLAGREYTLRVLAAQGTYQDVTVTIASEAFAARRVSYQSGPGVCFARVERELLEQGGAIAAAGLVVTDADLETYARASAVVVKRRRKPGQAAAEAAAAAAPGPLPALE